MDAVEQAKSGHPGMPMGMADVATVLFTQFLRFDPQAPDWPDRDRFVLSAGHGSMLLYALLHLTGYADMTLDELKHFRQLGSRTAGHPERGHAAGIETTTGPLGQGIGNSVGMALAERMLAAEFGERDRRSPHLRHRQRWRPDGRGQPRGGLARRPSRPQQADRVLRRQFDFDRRPDRAGVLRRPAAAVPGVWLGGRTDRRPRSRGDRRGYPAGTEQRSSEPHCLPHDDRLWGADQGRNRRGAWLAARRRRDRRRAPAPRVERAAFRDPRGHPRGVARGRRSWRTRAPRLGSAPATPLPGSAAPNSCGVSAGELPPGLDQAIAEFCDDFRQANAKIATRQASGTSLDTLTRVVPELVGGSADLTPSNNTKAKDQKDVRPRRLFRPLYPLRGARARDGGGDERHCRAWRADPLWRDIPDIFRLCPALDPARLIDGGRRHLCDDARFDRARRGRPDPSAGRAFGRVAGDPGPLRLPPGRPGRDRRMLGSGAATARRPVLARSDPPIAPAAAARRRTRKTARRAAPMCWPRPMGSAKSRCSRRAPRSPSR